jgi:hypothetical protein
MSDHAVLDHRTDKEVIASNATEWRGPDVDDPERLFDGYVDGIAAEHESHVAEILERCARIRHEPPERRVELLTPLLRGDWSQYPPKVADAVDDTLFYVYVICGCERAEAGPAPEDLPKAPA